MEQTVDKKTNLSIIGVAGLAFCGILVETSMNVTFPTLMKDLHQSLSSVQWVTTAYLLTVTLVITAAAYCQRRFNHKKLLTVAVIGFLVGDIICAAAPSLALLLLGRIIQGIGTGIALPLMFAIIMSQVPRFKQGTYVGMAGILIALAPSLGPTYGGTVAGLLSWRDIFLIVLPLGIIFGLIAVLNVKETKAEKIPFAIGQYLLLSFALICLTLGVNNIGVMKFTNPLVWGLLLIAIILFILFVYSSKKSKTPLLQLSILKEKTFTAALMIYFLVQFIQISFTFVIPNFAQLGLGQNSTISGLILLPGSLLSAILGAFNGKLLDRKGFKLPLVIGSSVTIIATLLFIIFSNHMSVLLLGTIYLVYMIGFSFIFNNSLTYGLQQLSPKFMGDGNAMFNTLNQYSGSLGTTVMSVFISLGQTLNTNVSTVKGVTIGSSWGYIFLFILALVAGICGLVILKHPED